MAEDLYRLPNSKQIIHWLREVGTRNPNWFWVMAHEVRAYAFSGGRYLRPNSHSHAYGRTIKLDRGVCELNNNNNNKNDRCRNNDSNKWQIAWHTRWWISIAINSATANRAHTIFSSILFCIYTSDESQCLCLYLTLIWVNYESFAVSRKL